MPFCFWEEWRIRGASEHWPAKFNPSMDVMMNDIDSLKEQIEKTEAILAESRENYRKNPGAYSARLLLMSTENYLADLLQQLDILEKNQEEG